MKLFLSCFIFFVFVTEVTFPWIYATNTFIAFRIGACIFPPLMIKKAFFDIEYYGKISWAELVSNAPSATNWPLKWTFVALFFWLLLFVILNWYFYQTITSKKIKTKTDAPPPSCPFPCLLTLSLSLPT